MKKTLSYRRIADAWLLQRLGLSDDLYWDWEAACIEVPKQEIEEAKLFGESMDSLVQRGCREKVLCACVHYYIQAETFKLPNKKELNSLISTCHEAARMIALYDHEIITLAEANGTTPPLWVTGVTSNQDDPSELSELFDVLPPPDKAAVLVRQLLRWCSKVMNGWDSPNAAPLTNGALPFSLYADMIYFDPALEAYRKPNEPATRGAQIVVHNLLMSVKPYRKPQRARRTARLHGSGPMDRAAESASVPLNTKTRDLDRETLRKNLNNFAFRSPKAFKPLRVKLVELHHWVAL